MADLDCRVEGNGRAAGEGDGVGAGEGDVGGGGRGDVDRLHRPPQRLPLRLPQAQ